MNADEVEKRDVGPERILQSNPTWELVEVEQEFRGRNSAGQWTPWLSIGPRRFIRALPGG